MARVPNIKKIIKEDFDKDQQKWIDKLAYPLNSFMEQVKSAFDHNINFTNLNQEIITVNVVVDSSGIPQVQTLWKSTLKTKIVGCVVLRAANIQNTSLFAVNQPFINFVQNADLVQINQVSGLQADNKYQLTVLSVGS